MSRLGTKRLGTERHGTTADKLVREAKSFTSTIQTNSNRSVSLARALAQYAGSSLTSSTSQFTMGRLAETFSDTSITDVIRTNSANRSPVSYSATIVTSSRGGEFYERVSESFAAASATEGSSLLALGRMASSYTKTMVAEATLDGVLDVNMPTAAGVKERAYNALTKDTTKSANTAGSSSTAVLKNQGED